MPSLKFVLSVLMLASAGTGLVACDSSEIEEGPSVTTSYFPLASRDFTLGVGGAVPGRVQTATFPMAGIDEAVNSRGVVLAHIDLLGGENGWYAMPLTVPVDTAVVALGYHHRVGEVSFTIEANRPGNYAGLFEGNTVKVVAVDPGVRGIEQARAAIEAGDPEQAVRVLGL